jgi:hypothetical protein
MAASKDKAQPVVLDTLLLRSCRILGVGSEPLFDVVRQRFESSAPADSVNSLETAGRDEPGARIGGHAIAWPLLQSSSEGFMQRFLGDIEVA